MPDTTTVVDLHLRVSSEPDPALAGLPAGLAALPGGGASERREPDPGGGAVAPRPRHPAREPAFRAMSGTARGTTVVEPATDALLPADERTARLLRDRG